MSLADLPILSAFKSKMRWHQARQTVLAENVANAGTPGYVGRDLKKVSFEQLLNPQKPLRVAALRTNAAHMTGGALSADPQFKHEATADWEVTPNGNSVVLEDQMMKVAENQMDFQMATSIYTRSLGLLKTAIGRRG